MRRQVCWPKLDCADRAILAAICELVGIPETDRPRWREYGATVVAGAGQDFAKAIPGIMDGAKAAIARRRVEPGDDLLADLITTQAENGDRLTDAEMVTLVWHLVIAGQTPTNLIANAVVALLSHPDQLAALREDPAHAGRGRGVDPLVRADTTVDPTLRPRRRRTLRRAVRKGEAVTTAIAAANRNPRVFADPERLDITRPKGQAGHLGFAHGPHFCVGASIARVQTQVALTALLRRYPRLAPASDPEELRAPDPGTWRLTARPMILDWALPHPRPA